MTMTRRAILIAAGALLTLCGQAIVTSTGDAATQLPGPVVGQASDTTPAVPGGQCYPTADQNACRRILELKQIGGWIYAGGIISSVTDRSGTKPVTTTGYHNIFRFSVTTHKVDTSWKPQFYRSAQTGAAAYQDSAVTGIATDGHGALYVAGSFSQVSPGPGAASAPRRGVAAISESDGSVLPFNAKVCSGGGSCVVNDVQYVDGMVWLGGTFTDLAGRAITALAFVNPSTGAISGTQLPVSGIVTQTVGTKVARMAINPQQTQAVMIGNFGEVGGAVHKEVAVLDVSSGGGAKVDPWNAPRDLDASGPQFCDPSDTWARGVDWDPSGRYFDIAASGGGGFDAFGEHGALCDAFTRFKSDGNPNTPYPLIVNETGFDSLFTVADTGNVVYTGGHNKYLDHGLYINGVKVKSSEESHFGIGAIDVNPADANYGRAVSSFNNSRATGRGAGWASSVSTGAGLYVGGDSQTVGTDKTIQRLAYFAAS